MNTLIIYDNAGYILDIRSGEPSPREPNGVPFLWVEIPQGKQLKIRDGIGVDVSVSPHQAFLEDIPKSDVQILKERQDATEEALLGVLLGGM
ncbi:hypothetical protein KP77_24950 [Jeotgalibacillus alimentarius]|uniref:Uncharacterized protein n=1 Tax=Jeotgalibacillus alimentarius TaxID=135826 RepID=A0A0C2VDA1_9BACL|nr:hypothetical protein [Jeotgalibacillus alimentarius]KIL46927.1 hypothetical protein KP77_24950 [Jeotgalibacillus alimentarius]